MALVIISHMFTMIVIRFCIISYWEKMKIQISCTRESYTGSLFDIILFFPCNRASRIEFTLHCQLYNNIIEGYWVNISWIKFLLTNIKIEEKEGASRKCIFQIMFDTIAGDKFKMFWKAKRWLLFMQKQFRGS